MLQLFSVHAVIDKKLIHSDLSFLYGNEVNRFLAEKNVSK